jgi:hypothetical protein
MKKLIPNLGATLAACISMSVSTASAAFISAEDFNNATANPVNTGGLDPDTSNLEVVVITQDLTWTNDNVYILPGIVFIENGATLTIEPGTVIRSLGSNASGGQSEISNTPGALVVARGGKIISNGTAELPVVFTNLDDPNVPGGVKTVPFDGNPDLNTVTNLKGTAIGPFAGISVEEPGTALGRDYDPQGPIGDNGQAYGSEWGGVILLGRSNLGYNNATGTEQGVDPDAGGPRTNGDPNTNNIATSNGIGAQYIEGVDAVQYGSRGIYGGTNDDDNSGWMRFTSIRYAGFKLADANEINGLTQGATGRNTVIDWVEVYNNGDDGYEWFGGFSQNRFLFSLCNGDDCFDYDQGFQGKGQFWLAVQDNEDPIRTATSTKTGRVDGDGDSVGEFDGAESPNTSLPISNPTIYNLTAVGPSADARLTINFKDNSGGNLRNILLQSIPSAANGLNYSSSPAGVATLNVISSLWDSTNLTAASASSADFDSGDKNMLLATNNTGTVSSPDANLSSEPNQQIVAIGRVDNNSLDPRLASGVVARAATYATPAPLDGFFTPAAFIGGMCDNNMLAGWSVLAPKNLNILTAAANTARPEVSISVSAGEYVVSFDGVDGVRYSVERSTDNKKTYEPIGVVTASVGTDAFNDTVTAPAVGQAVFFRVVPL